MSETRELRLNFIRQLLFTDVVTNQDELQKKLTSAGFAVTQSSVSRDLADLGVQKQNGRYVLRAANEVRSIGVVSARTAGPNLLVLRTAVGAAQVVAYQLDQLGLNQIIGTVAGDDTIFVATGSPQDQGVIAKAVGVNI